MLTDEISEEIVRLLQHDTLKSIFGFDVPYFSALEKSGLESLTNRREKLALNFALSLEKNPKFSEWFPPHVDY